jgi:antitoxin component of RelBE/YafQ-DinJ toxin-antitoxin module
MVIKTFNLEEDVYKQFADFCKAHGLSMSKQINIFIKSQIETEPKVREEYLQRLESIRKGRFIKVGSIENFKKRYA